MMNRMIWAVGLLAMVLSNPLSTPTFGQHWYKGEFHSHSAWSDGGVFPEDAVQWYRQRDYHFLCLSDHVRLQNDVERYIDTNKPPKRITKEVWEQYLANESHRAETKSEKGRTLIRLKTIDELKARFDSQGTFLLIPSLELTGKFDDHQLHMNAINVAMTIAYQQGDTLATQMALNAKVTREHGENHGLQTMFILNHPFWRYYDVPVEVLIEHPEVKFCELNNNGLTISERTIEPHPEMYDTEKFWDIANAFRLLESKSVLYMVGSTDRHVYTAARTMKGCTWVCAPELSSDAIVSAMNQGNFYIAAGEEQARFNFDSTTKTISAQVIAEGAEEYTMEFVGTKINFDQTKKTFDIPAVDDVPARQGTKYSEEVGKILTSVSGKQANYSLAADDLYVRVRVRRNSDNKLVLWSQPFSL